jgi:hypothetical protein
VISVAGWQRTRSAVLDVAEEVIGIVFRAEGSCMTSRLPSRPATCPSLHSSFTKHLPRVFITLSLICLPNEGTFIEHFVCART